MNERKTDRRSLKTQKILKEGLAELLTEKELRNITVQEVSDKADVHRVTFYKHFYDIYDLYEQMEKEVLADLGLLILKFHDNPTENFGKELVDYIEKNPKYFKMIFSPHNTGGMRCKFLNMIEGVFHLIQTEKCKVDFNDNRLEYLSAFWSSGCVAVVEKWVQNDYAQSRDFVIKTISELDNNMEKLISAKPG